MAVFDDRPDPDSILSEIKKTERVPKGRLKIFFGYAAGVGKTYAMLDEAREQMRSGVNVLVGHVEPHSRPETMDLLSGLPILPPKQVNYRNLELKEFDLDAALQKKPELILVDELAHTNAGGVRNKKRYQDVEELLSAGIDVYTTVNVQHIESLNDVVQDITKIAVRETVPDYIFDHADMIKLIDIEPEELLRRFEDGKIYKPERAVAAMGNFFTIENLRLLREIAMRKAADRISHDNQNERRLSDKMANIKLLVCIGASQSSAKCIRWTARTAEAFHAPWTALYIETEDKRKLSEKDRKSLRENMDLAEKLGAETITLNGHSIAQTVAQYAALCGITNIVVGKSRNKRFFKGLFWKDLEDELIALLPTIEVHIIPSQIEVSSNIHKTYLPKKISLSWQDALKTFLLLIIATAISFGLRASDIGDQNIIMIYILFVLIISRMTMGYAYGVIASVLAVLSFNYFFTIPYFTLTAIQQGYPITFLIMLLVALITSTTTVRMKTQARLAVERERRTEVLYEINKKLLVTRGLQNIIDVTSEYMVKLFARSIIFYTKDPGDGSFGHILQLEGEKDASFLNSDSERAVAHWAFLNQKRAGAGTDTLMGARAYYMPVAIQGKVLGVIGLSCMRGNLSQNSRLMLRMIASQVAMALERQNLSDEQRKIMVESEKEKMRSNLLRAISHDLRTPLTGILGASSAILENRGSLDIGTQNKLITNIKEDSQWLIRMVENLLSVTRINEGTMNVTKTPEAAEEIVAEAIGRIRSRFPERDIRVAVPDELLIVPMDGTLIVQVLLNLLENALKHSGAESPIEVKVTRKGNEAVFEVSDSGEGISEDELPYLFESYAKKGKSSDSSRGMGIGLSICMSIIKAHNGTMVAANKQSGGAVFRFILPLKEDA